MKYNDCKINNLNYLIVYFTYTVCSGNVLLISWRYLILNLFRIYFYLHSQINDFSVYGFISKIFIYI